jgi:DNA (cytosine-5)-methyltransferase 1
MLRVLDLFSGIGGFSLGLERTSSFRTVAFCEIKEYPRRVLRRHWPDVPIYEDVRTLDAAALQRDGIAVDVICGGFPCQDLSFAGKRAGLQGARSGLWSEYARLIGDVRPRFVIVENVPGLLSLGFGTVLGDMAALGYDAVWDCIPASAVGAPHRRDRVWCVAYSHDGQRVGSLDAVCARRNAVGAGGQDVADASGARLPHYQRGSQAARGPWHGAADSGGCAGRASHDWRAEPDVGRVAHGVPARVDRLRALGNAVVPQIAELIGRAILEAEGVNP